MNTTAPQGLSQREIGTGTITVVFAVYIAGLLGPLPFALGDSRVVPGRAPPHRCAVPAGMPAVAGVVGPARQAYGAGLGSLFTGAVSATLPKPTTTVF